MLINANNMTISNIKSFNDESTTAYIKATDPSAADVATSPTVDYY